MFILEYLLCCGMMALLMYIIIAGSAAEQELKLEWEERRRTKRKN